MRSSILHFMSAMHPRRAAMRALLWSLATLASALSMGALGAQVPARATAAQPQLKGVFEPVSFTEDIDLIDVSFVNANVGWAAGKAGTIIRTTNGGAAWTAQLGGDPQNRAANVRLIRFVDERHGWAVQGTPGSTEKLLHTSDGESWEEIGTPPRGVTDIAFTSTTLGFAATDPPTGSSYSGLIYRTTDGGRTWNEIWTCNAKVSLGGLNKQVGCRIAQFHFVTPTVGYAAAKSIGFGMGSEPPPMLAKTTDGGESWEAMLGPGTVDKDGVTTVFFLNDQTGFARLTSDKLHMTSDGGRTWRGIVASPGIDIRFADPGVGWGVEVGRLDPTVSFTTDGGARWNSRDIRFPATVRAFSFPRRDRAYFVGDNGMVFRYSVVPASRPLGSNDIAAPAMPAFESALDDQVAQLEQVIGELRSSLSSGGAGTTAGAASASGTAATGAVTADAGVASGGGVGSGDALGAPLAPPSAFTANCCKKSFSRLEVILGALSKTLPEFIGKYRNLNLLMATVRMGAELPGQYRSVKGGLNGFAKAEDREGAQAALAAVSAALSAFKQTTAVSMQKQLPPAGG
jgi:photosystem II stability/assembly factor-like uncharacterized protein